VEADTTEKKQGLVEPMQKNQQHYIQPVPSPV